MMLKRPVPEKEPLKELLKKHTLETLKQFTKGASKVEISWLPENSELRPVNPPVDPPQVSHSPSASTTTIKSPSPSSSSSSKNSTSSTSKNSTSSTSKKSSSSTSKNSSSSKMMLGIRRPGTPVLHSKSNLSKITYKDFTDSKSIEVSGPKPYFLLQASGDLQLKANRVKFDGFRILLQSESTEFVPRYDVVVQKEGLFVAVEIPGLWMNENGQLEDASIKEEIIFVDGMDGKGSNLQLSGEKCRIFVAYEKDEKDAGQWKRQKLKDEKEIIEKVVETIPQGGINQGRQFGPFTIVIPLPQNIEDNLDKADIVVTNGLYLCFLPNKVTKQVAKRNKI